MSTRDKLTLVREVLRDFFGLDHRHPKHHDREGALFFKDGWGDDDGLGKLARHDFLLHPTFPIAIEWKKERREGGARIKEGTFSIPFLTEFLPAESQLAHVKLILPEGDPAEIPVSVLFAMTGDEGFEQRERAFSRPLLSKGIGTLLLENSYYGARKPPALRGFMLPTVRDMLAMSVASVEEGKALVAYLHKEGHRHVGVGGVSQGAMIAAVVGAQSPSPVAIAASLAAHSPEVIFTEGLLRTFVDWDSLPAKSAQEHALKFRELFRAGDLTRLPVPRLPQAAYLLGAKRDLVVPKNSVLKLHATWPGSKLRWLPGTHLTSLALHSRGFRKLIVDSFKSLKKYGDFPTSESFPSKVPIQSVK